MDYSAASETLRKGEPLQFPADANTIEFARSMDSQDPISHLRDEFVLPTKGSIKKKALNGRLPGGEPMRNQHAAGAATNGHANGSSGDKEDDDNETGIYFVGNSLGAQPKAVRTYVDAQLETWASIGVNGHFAALDDSPLTSWQDMAEDCANKSAAIVGAKPGEVVIMNTLTANLHFLLASFYKPTEQRHKIILEWKPFPSDHYAIESQMVWHGLSPEKSMVQIQPDENSYIPTAKILATIDEHADSTALLLLPGIQYYSGQLFDIPTITAHAQSKGIVVGWDLAHAAGNAELALHDWDVDFACWCTYKYLNAGPGAIAGAFVHERHSGIASEKTAGGETATTYRPRLMGWYGHDKATRFNMDNRFQPAPGAAGFQVSNPSAIDLASLSAALSVFQKTTMRELRGKAVLLTAYAEHLLDGIAAEYSSSSSSSEETGSPPLRIITPRSPLERGTQLSVLLRDGLLETVARDLEEAAVLCDRRKPGVIRVAPVPLYSRFEDVWRFMQVLRGALAKCA